MALVSKDIDQNESLRTIQLVENEIFSAKIIVAEDMKFMRQMIFNILDQAGYKNIFCAEDGKEAKDLTLKIKPDILILDLNMPLMSGYDVCEWVRADEELSDIPILVQSMLETTAERNKAFEVGATDFVTKPINPTELLARVAIHLENRFLVLKLSNYNQRVSEELLVAREMQSSLMPSENMISAMRNKHGVDIKSYSKTSSELGGDVWGLIDIDDDHLGFYILDVSGHGIAAALHTFRIHQVLHQVWEGFTHPGKVIQTINKLIAPHMKTGQFATILCGVINVNKGTLLYASAAQPTPILISTSENGCCAERCASDGPFIGINKTMKYEMHKKTFGKGSNFLTYSDALIETKNAKGEMLGEEGLYKYINDLIAKKPSKGIFDPLIKFFNKDYERNLKDDLTVLNIINIGKK